MEQLLEQLRTVLSNATQKVEELKKKENEINGEKQYLAMKQKELYDERSKYDAMVHHEMRVGELLEREKAVAQKEISVQESAEAVRDEKEKFEIWKTGEEKRIAVELQEIDKEWKKIRG